MNLSTLRSFSTPANTASSSARTLYSTSQSKVSNEISLLKQCGLTQRMMTLLDPNKAADLKSMAQVPPNPPQMTSRHDAPVQIKTPDPNLAQRSRAGENPFLSTIRSSVSPNMTRANGNRDQALPKSPSSMGTITQLMTGCQSLISRAWGGGTSA